MIQQSLTAGTTGAHERDSTQHTCIQHHANIPTCRMRCSQTIHASHTHRCTPPPALTHSPLSTVCGIPCTNPISGTCSRFCAMVFPDSHHIATDVPMLMQVFQHRGRATDRVEIGHHVATTGRTTGWRWTWHGKQTSASDINSGCIGCVGTESHRIACDHMVLPSLTSA